MERIKIAPSYEIKWLEVERPQALIDNNLERLALNVLSGHASKDITNKVYDDFKIKFQKHLFNSKLNALSGFEGFNRIDIINGCTQFIDNIYMSDNPPQTIKGDYRYHERLQRCIYFTEPGKLVKGLPLIIAMPFPRIGAKHEHMQEILDEAYEKNIEVHIDGAWISCCRDIVFDCNHPAIKSIAISLSKGLGLGWNRIGLRWSNVGADSITIMNDFNMNNRALAIIANYFLDNVESDYLWNHHSDNYYKICRDFNLTPTNCIFLAKNGNQPVGLSPLLRYLENENTI